LTGKPSQVDDFQSGQIDVTAEADSSAPDLFACEIFCAGTQKYPPDPPSRPDVPGNALSGRSQGGKVSGRGFKNGR